jgi:hypothetical protein
LTWPNDDDVVYVHVAAEGWFDSRLGRKEFVRAYYPMEIGSKSRTAIAWTTAGSVAAVIEMVRFGALPNSGFLKQESIPLEVFLKRGLVASKGKGDAAAGSRPASTKFSSVSGVSPRVCRLA